jgi:hypothetical protein
MSLMLQTRETSHIMICNEKRIKNNSATGWRKLGVSAFMRAMIAEKCSGETGIAFAITEHTANQIYVQAMILWAQQFILMPGHPSDDCLPAWLTSWLHCVTNAQPLAYVTTIEQFLNKRFRKQGIAFFITMVLLKICVLSAAQRCSQHCSRVKAVFFLIHKRIQCTDIIHVFCTLYFYLFFLSRSHSWGFWVPHNNTTQSEGFLWTSDQLVAETSIWQHTTLPTEWQSCLQLDSNPQSQQACGRKPMP